MLSNPVLSDVSVVSDVVGSYVWNIKDKDSHLKARSSDLDVLSRFVDVPEGNRVYPSCPHSIMILIVVHYVDNNGILYNCRELVDEFYVAIRDDGHIDLNFVAGAHLVSRHDLHLRSCYRRCQC